MDHVLKRFCNRHHVVLHKGENLHILLTLAWNRVLLLKLRLYKWLHGIHRPIVHYYAVCWNEEKMLPFMFDYYTRFTDRFTIYDNYSTEKSEAIVNDHPHASIIKFQTDGFNDNAHNDIKNNCWKRSRGKADYVIVCDIDEFLYHEHLSDFLHNSNSDHYSIFRTTGYHMYSSSYPEHEDHKALTDVIKHGVPDFYFDKQIIFDPHRIVEINYEIGAHKAHPWGIVKEKDTHGALKMLHYKNLSVEHLLARSAQYANRLSKVNIDNGWGEHNLKKEQEIRESFNEGMSNAIQVIP